MDKGEGCAVAFAVLALVLFALLAITPFMNQHTMIATVEKTYVDDGDTFFVLVDENGHSESYENEDNILFGKMNSGDILMNVSIGETYKFYVSGIRVQLLSMFPNIITAERIE